MNISVPVYLQIASGQATASAIPCVNGGTMATISTVCGNGKVEAFEDCDFTLNPTTCSKTCRTVLP